MNKGILQIINTWLAIGLLFALGSPAAFAAGNATMTLSPSSTTVAAGNNFALQVSLNGNGENIDTARAIVQYPANLVQAVNFSLNGPLGNTSPGNYLNNSGTLSGGGFTVGGGVNGQSNFAVITFRALAVGTANISLSPSSRAISAGVEKINTGSLNTATITITDQLPSPTSPSGTDLVITSPTHPDIGEWYNSDHAVFNWTAVGNRYRWTFDTKSESEGRKGISSREVTINKLRDGISYFHLTTEVGGEDVTLHYPIQNDQTVPRRFSPFLEVGEDNLLMLRFSTTDATSGIDRYEVQLNEGLFVEQSSPYPLEGLSVGENMAIIRAFDMAGNFREGWIQFVVNEDGTIREIAKSRAACSLGGLPLQLSICCDYPAFCQYGIWVILILILLLILVIKNRKKRKQ